MLILVCGWFLRSGRRSALTLRMMSTPPVLSSATEVATSGIAADSAFRDYDDFSAVFAANTEQTTLGRKTLGSVTSTTAPQRSDSN